MQHQSNKNWKHTPKKPPWITVKTPRGENYDTICRLKRASGLHTVCESARCPNIGECWPAGHATFLIMGDGCTRNCAFCGVGKKPVSLEADEPQRVAEAVAAMGLDHAVVTSVTRDDLPDGGAAHFAKTIEHIRGRCPDTTTEVLIPDFKGSREALKRVVDAGPGIIGHNMETVRRLYPEVRPEADYAESLTLFCAVHAMAPDQLTKSGIMVGLGESLSEVYETIQEIRAADVDILTIGQYLQPGPENIEVFEYVLPETFAHLKDFAEALGFAWVESGPLVRSSYRAAEQARALLRG
ncbi:MAG: lipoyl synthase [Thermodesulfobacteriota bacterium]